MSLADMMQGRVRTAVRSEPRIAEDDTNRPPGRQRVNLFRLINATMKVGISKNVMISYERKWGISRYEFVWGCFGCN